MDERGGQQLRIKLPLALVRAFGDWPIEVGCHRRAGEERRCARLSRVFEALDGGESLVEIDGDGARVRVWVE